METRILGDAVSVHIPALLKTRETVACLRRLYQEQSSLLLNLSHRVSATCSFLESCAELKLSHWVIAKLEVNRLHATSRHLLLVLLVDINDLLHFLVATHEDS